MATSKQLVQVGVAELPSFCSSLLSKGFRLFVMDAPASPSDFFLRATTNFPLNPPINGFGSGEGINWDALTDSIWGGLDACPETKIALVVRDIRALRDTDEAGFSDAIESMLDPAVQVSESKFNDEHVTSVILVVVGV